ncbi:MAG: hypothetical protein IK078_02885, partial [Lachnospiraceae bacterium]|nr:hypothetical protein [Lachnospiraceae bacterium]
MNEVRGNMRQTKLIQTEKKCLMRFAALMLSVLLAFTPAGMIPGAGVVMANAETVKPPRVTEEEKALFKSPADPFSYNSFGEMYQNGGLKTSYSKSVDISVSGNNM